MSKFIEKVKEKLPFGKHHKAEKTSAYNDDSSSSSSSDEEGGLLGKKPIDKIHHWRPNKNYVLGDKTKFKSQQFECIQAHTSSKILEPPTSPGFWKLSSTIIPGEITTTGTTGTTGTTTGTTSGTEDSTGVIF